MLKTNNFVSVLGTNPNNSMKHQNGLDAIDLEAIRQENAVKGLREMRPTRLARINRIKVRN